MITVLLVDDHRLLRIGLESLLAGADDIEVIGSAGSGPEAVALAADTPPDVVLMDLSMPEMGGVSATRQLLAVAPDSAVVVLTSFADAELVVAAVEAGAVGYLLKDTNPDELLRAVRVAALGGSPLDPTVARTLLGWQRAGGGNGLTEREREVLRLIAKALPNKQIALALGISERTVKAHLTSAYSRIGVTDRTQAALWAQRNGLAADPAGHPAAQK